MEKKKFGKGYYQAGHGRGFKSNPTIYLIDGFAYAKDLDGWRGDFDPLKGILEGYVRVNCYEYFDGTARFYQVSGQDHKVVDRIFLK